MIKMTKATLKDAHLLSKLSVDTFLPAHGHSAPKNDINNYLTQNFNEQKFIEELSDCNNQYSLIFFNGKIAGYSKIVFF